MGSVSAYKSLPVLQPRAVQQENRPLSPVPGLGVTCRAENEFSRAHVLLRALCLINLYHRDGNETDQGLGCLWCTETQQV